MVSKGIVSYLVADHARLHTLLDRAMETPELDPVAVTGNRQPLHGNRPAIGARPAKLAILRDVLGEGRRYGQPQKRRAEDCPHGADANTE